MSEVKVYPPIILKPEDSFNQLLEKLYAEGWGINSAEYMQADTPEEAVKLQAKSFPCLEFQPVQLSKPDQLYPYHHEGKWVAFHRTPKPKTPDSYGDWTVYYNSTEKYWFLRNEKTLQDHPKHFDHSPTLDEIKEALGEENQSISLELGKYTCLKCGFKGTTHEEMASHQCSQKQETPMKESLPTESKQESLPCDKQPFNEEECKTCPDPCTDYCSHGIHKAQQDLDPECENCEERDCEEPDALETGKVHQVIKDTSRIPIILTITAKITKRELTPQNQHPISLNIDGKAHPYVSSGSDFGAGSSHDTVDEALKDLHEWISQQKQWFTESYHRPIIVKLDTINEVTTKQQNLQAFF